jgi:superfamily II DNA or RNA helicase
MTPQQIYATRIGEFIPKVKKGDRLKQNDVIGTIVYKYSWETRREDVVAPFECTIAFISKNRDINSIENKNFASIAKIVHYVD